MSRPDPSPPFDRSALKIDAAAEVQFLVGQLRRVVHQELRRKGAVVGISGGIDSSVVLALCAQALGADRVVGIIMPERESSSESELLARLVAERCGVKHVTECLTSVLEELGCYRRRDEAIERLFPDFGPGWKAKITLPGSLLDKGTLNVFHLTVISPEGRTESRRLPPKEYYQVVAASNFKQRARMNMLYYHAELRHYSVIGTANKNEHELGFFVKYGDGGADVQPIVHLFKSQVYQLAEYLHLPREVCERTPTTDTYSAGGSQEEFFFRVPTDILDLVWLGHERGASSDEIGEVLGLAAKQVDHVIADIVRKRKTTGYLRTTPLFLSCVRHESRKHPSEGLSDSI